MSDKLSAEGVQERLDSSPFIRFLGLKVVSVDHESGEIEMSMPMKSDFERRAGTGQYHGGVIASIIDIAGDFALGMMVGTGLPTVNFRVDYLRPAMNSGLTAVAKIRRMGRTLGFADVDVFDDEKRLVAIGRGTFSMNVG
jgi:uncharacterized protein (TIGR00369 family)